MNNQVKQQIDKETFVNFLKSEINNWNGSSDMYASVRVDCLQWVIDRIENNNAQVGLIDTPPVPTIGCSECDYKGYFEYETGVVDEGTQIMEIAKEPCDCVIDRIPTIKPGDKVRHKRFKTLPTGIVRSISESGKRALVKWDDYNSAYYELINLEVVE